MAVNHKESRIGFRERKLFTDRQYDQLTTNGINHHEDHDAIPCVYLLGSRTAYLLSEICSDKAGMVYGLYYELGVPQIGYISLESIYKYHENVDHLFNKHGYQTKYKISVFKRIADEFGRIVPDDYLLEDVFEKYDFD